MSFEQPADGSSIIHSLDARFKVCSAVIIICTAAALNYCSSVLVIMLFALSSVLLLKQKAKSIFYRSLIPNMLIVSLWIFIPFTTGGDIVATLWGMDIFAPGIERALLITLKCNAILLTVISYISSVPPVKLCQTLNKLGLNKKLTILMFFFNSYLDAIYREFNKLQNILKTRGFRPSTNLHTYKTFGILIGVMIVRSWERAERIYAAMQCRGFNGEFYCFIEFKSTKKDYCFVLICIGVTAMALYLDLCRINN